MYFTHYFIDLVDCITSIFNRVMIFVILFCQLAVTCYWVYLEQTADWRLYVWQYDFNLRLRFH